MKSLTLLALAVITAPLCWGENVWYCAEEASYQLAAVGGEAQMAKVQNQNFSFQYEEQSSQLAMRGTGWDGENIYYLDCKDCDGRLLSAKSNTVMFNMLPSGHFFISLTNLIYVHARTGTCTRL